MPDKETKEEGWFPKLMGFLKYIAGIVHEFFKANNRKAEQKDREEFRKNEEAKQTVDLRNEAEDLVEQAKNEDDKEKVLEEIRKRTAK